jgi:ubiquinone/menaquinone biosynthesis C-methylase UbiE
MVNDEVWKQSAVVNRYLSSRTAIPMVPEQIGMMMSILGSRQEPVRNFIDLGCGDGILGAAILNEYPSARGVFADFSEPMLAQAREQLKPFASQLEFENLDYGDPAWLPRMQPLSPFDAIVSGYSIHHQPDARKREIYAEIYSLLEPGGWFVNIEHVASEAQLTIDLFNKHIIDSWYEQEKLKDGTRTREEIAETYMNRPDKDANILLSVETQCEWLRELGYEQADCYFRVLELAVFAGRKPNQKS